MGRIPEGVFCWQRVAGRCKEERYAKRAKISPTEMMEGFWCPKWITIGVRVDFELTFNDTMVLSYIFSRNAITGEPVNQTLKAMSLAIGCSDSNIKECLTRLTDANILAKGEDGWEVNPDLYDTYKTSENVIVR